MAGVPPWRKVVTQVDAILAPRAARAQHPAVSDINRLLVEFAYMERQLRVLIKTVNSASGETAGRSVARSTLPGRTVGNLLA